MYSDIQDSTRNMCPYTELWMQYVLAHICLHVMNLCMRIVRGMCVHTRICVRSVLLHKERHEDCMLVYRIVHGLWLSVDSCKRTRSPHMDLYSEQHKEHSLSYGITHWIYLRLGNLTRNVFPHTGTSPLALHAVTYMRHYSSTHHDLLSAITQHEYITYPFGSHRYELPTNLAMMLPW